jgi:hypothetical protein
VHVAANYGGSNLFTKAQVFDLFWSHVNGSIHAGKQEYDQCEQIA